MTNEVGLTINAIDNTKPGLLSALNTAQRITPKIAEKLMLEMKVVFPDVASKMGDFKKQLSDAKSAMGKIDFMGDRLGKRGNVLGMLGFDGKDLRRSMSLENVKGYISQLKTIQSKLNDNTLRSANYKDPMALSREKKQISDAISALERYKTSLELALRTKAKFNAELTRRASQSSLSAEERRLAILNKINEVEARYNSASGINNKISRLNAERSAIGSMIPLYEQLVALDKKQGLDSSANQARLNALRQEHAQIKNNIDAERQLQQAQRASQRATNATRGISKNIREYNQQRALNKELYNNTAKTTADTKRYLDQEYSSVVKLRKAWEALRQKLVDSGKATNLARIDQRIARLKQEEVQLYRNRDATRQNMRLEQQYSRQSGLLGRLGGLAARYFNVYMVANFVRKVAETTGYFEQQQVALEGILNSASKAKEILGEIQNFALKSPFQTKELVQFTKQLSAFGIDSDALFPTVKELADISTGLGVEMSRIILAYGQVKSAAVLRGQELRQFTEAGIPMVKALADKFTDLNGKLVTTAEVFEMISKRQVSFEIVADVMSSMTKEGGKFYKMQENVTNTLYGQIQKLKDVWTLAMKDMGESSGGMLNGIVKLLQSLVKNAKVFAISIASAFVGRTIANMKEYVRLLKTSATLQSSLTGFGVAAAFAIIGGLIARAVSKAKELDKELSQISKSFTKENDKIVEGLNSLSKKITVAKIGTKEFSDAVNTLAQNYGDFVSSSVIEALRSQGEEAENVAKNFAEIAENVKQAAVEYNKYEEIRAKRKAAADKFAEKGEDNTFTNWMIGGNMFDLEGPMKDFLHFYGRNAEKSDLKRIWKDLHQSALSTFSNGENYTKEEFLRIFREVILDKFPSIEEDAMMKILELGWNAQFVDGTFGKKDFQKLLDLQKDLEASVYHRQRMYFNAVDPNKTVAYSEDKVSSRDNLEAAYIEALFKTINDRFFADIPTFDLQQLSYIEKASKVEETLKEYLSNGGANDEYIKGLKKQISLLKLLGKLSELYVEDAGRIKASELFDNNSVYQIQTLLDQFKDTFDKDSPSQKWIANVRDLFNDKVDLKTDRAAKVSDLMENNMFYLHTITDEAVKGLWYKYIPKNETYESLREQVAKDYKDVVDAIKSYVEQGGKDKDVIDSLKLQKKALETLASAEYFNIKLDDENSKSQQLPNELAELIEEMKNAYTRYREATQKGGVNIGLDYVRNNEYFKSMFGQFFVGANSDLFAEKVANIKVGNTTAGELLKDAFMDTDTEQGILNFKQALTSIANALRSYGKADKENRKSYLTAAKNIEKWVDNTFSKNNLDAQLKALEGSIKTLTNSFDKANKAVDVYRQLQDKGTSSTLGKILGITREQAMAPESIRLREEFSRYIEELNSKLPDQAQKYDVGPLHDVGDVYAALDKLEKITELNAGAFGVEGWGTQINKETTTLLKKLLETMLKELTSISIEVYSGNTMADLIANAMIKYQSRYDKLTTQENVARTHGMYDWGAIQTAVKGNQDAAKAIFEQFINDNRLDALARGNGNVISMEMLDKLEEKLINIANKFPEALSDELRSKLEDLKNKVAEFNVSASAPNAFGQAISDYRNAGSRAEKLWSDEEKKKDEYSKMLAYAKAAGVAEEIDRWAVAFKESDARLKEMGGSVDALAEKLRNIALENLKKSIQECQDKFQSMVSVVNSVVSAAKSFSKTINKVYDILNDGENPEWMQEMDGFLNDFGDAFDDLIAPITSVISVVASLTTAMAALGVTATVSLWWMAGIVAVAAVVSGIIAAFQSHDRKLERQIEDLEYQIEQTQNAISNLESASERMVGLEKQEAQLKSLSLTYEQYKKALEKARSEQAKTNSDPKQYEQYMQEAQKYLDEFLNGLYSWREEMVFVVEDMANTIADALRSAFQSGENAAREAAIAIKQSIGDMIWNMTKMTVIEPLIKGAMEDFFGGDVDTLKERFMSDGKFNEKDALEYFVKIFSDEEAIKNLEKTLNTITQGTIDTISQYSEGIKDYMTFNADTSSLSGGISGITEDTARQLEGLQNSMLMQLVMINKGMSEITQSSFATIQTSWFNDMLLQTRLIQTATTEMNDAIKEMRNGYRPMSVRMV
jgi:tape measure domain-containing protein